MRESALHWVHRLQTSFRAWSSPLVLENASGIGEPRLSPSGSEGSPPLDCQDGEQQWEPTSTPPLLGQAASLQLHTTPPPCQSPRIPATTLLSTFLPAADLPSISRPLLASGRSLCCCHQAPPPATAHWQSGTGLAQLPDPGGGWLALAPQAPGGPAPHISRLDRGAVSIHRNGCPLSDLLLPHAHTLDLWIPCRPGGEPGPSSSGQQTEEVQIVDEKHLLLLDETVVYKGPSPWPRTPESLLSEGAGGRWDEPQWGLLLYPWKIVHPELHI